MTKFYFHYSSEKTKEILNSEDMKDALTKGLEENSCPYRCREMPESYRHPGRIITALENEETTHNLLIDAMDKAWKR